MRNYITTVSSSRLEREAIPPSKATEKISAPISYVKFSFSSIVAISSKPIPAVQ